MVTILAFVLPRRRQRPGGAATLGKNSVGSRQLKAKSVTTGKIANNAINGSKVANGTLTGQDIKLSAPAPFPPRQTPLPRATPTTVGGHSSSCPPDTTAIGASASKPRPTLRSTR
jgi:hypothetical protein